MCFTFTTDEFTQAPHISGSYPDINESILLPSQLIMACFFFAFVLCHADIGDDPLEIPRGNYTCIHSGTSTDDAVEHPPTATILGFELWPCSPSARRQAGRSSPKTAGFGSQKKSPLNLSSVGDNSGNKQEQRGMGSGGNPGGHTLIN